MQLVSVTSPFSWYRKTRKFLHAATEIYRELLYNIISSGARVTDVPNIIIIIDCEQPFRLCGARSGSPQL